MNHTKFFLPLFCLLPVLWGCFSTEKKEEQKPAAVYSARIDSAPSARTPEEALHQLLEGNSRYAHHESRWLALSSTQTMDKPFVMVVNAGAGKVVPEEVFDLPRGSIPMLPWRGGRTEWKALEAGMDAGVKLVLVLMPYLSADWPETIATTTKTRKTNQLMHSIFQELRMGSRALSHSIAQQQCQLVGAVLHPVSQRLICLAPSN